MSSRLRIGVSFIGLMLLILHHSVYEPARASTRQKIDTYSFSDWSHFDYKSTQNPGRNSSFQRVLTPETYLTAISTDKPIYRTNEKLYARGVLLSAYNHKPFNHDENTTAHIRIRGPKGEIAASGQSSTVNSVWTFEWNIPTGMNGGEYKIEASYEAKDCLPAERKFELHAFREPRLSSLITFARNAYGPGENVTASLKVKRTEGGYPAGARVSVDARVDGTAVGVEPCTVDAKGECTVSFKLPARISHGQGTLAMTIQDGGIVETTSKTIPLVVQTMTIDTYPEGGELIADCKNRVYVQAFRHDGKPADLVANVVSKNDGKTGQTVTQFRTEHEGRGRFEFIPKKGTTYALKILKPEGIRVTFPIQSVKADGAVIHNTRDVYKTTEPVAFLISSTHRKLNLIISKRQRKLVTRTIDFELSKFKTLAQKLVKVTIPTEADGVLIATITDESGRPIAERLVFREAANPLIVKIKPDKPVYGPRNTVKLIVKTTDNKGKPVAATVGVTVTDESVLKLVDKRERAPRLPVMMYLEPEVRDLAAASFYFDRNNPKAPLAIDLLLGTQGWRRFAIFDMSKFIRENGDSARRAISFEHDVINGNTPANASLGRFKAWFGTPLRSVNPNYRTDNLRSGVAGRLMTPPHRPDTERNFSSAAKPIDSWIQAPIQPPPDAGYEPTEARRPSARWDFAPNIWKKESSPLSTGYNQLSSADQRASWLRSTSHQENLSGRGNLFHAPIRRRLTPDEPVNVPSDFQIVRIYAHKQAPGNSNQERNDFQDTIYWNAGVRTDAKTGTAVLSFSLNDSVTTFQAFADGFTDSGSLGDTAAEVKSHRAFYTEAKFPTQVSSGDKIKLPVNIINESGTALGGVRLTADLPTAMKEAVSITIPRNLKNGERLRQILPIIIGFNQKLAQFSLNVSSGAYHDKIVRQLRIKPTGFPVEKTFGGLVTPGKVCRLKVNIEKNVLPASIETHIQLLTSPLAKLTAALERMIQEPCGCFEQTAATSYPLTMAQQYFLTHTDIDPTLVKRSKENLEIGYKKLLGYRCSGGGFECFGKAPGNTVLTAYGLLHFTDMAKVMEVDEEMISATRKWLMDKRDGRGGFVLEHHSAHAWSADQDCSNAYIVWALLESGEPASKLQNELNRLKNVAESSQNAYVVALAANAFSLAGQNEIAASFMDRLAAQQLDNGSISGITNSIVGSAGDALNIEGTSLATLAWFHNQTYLGNVQKSIKFLTDTCQGGRYGSTQATVLALRCIVAYDKLDTRIKLPGRIRLSVDGEPTANWVAFDSNDHEAIELPDLSKMLSSGEHTIDLRMENGNELPFTAAIKYNKATLDSDKKCQIDLSVRLSQNRLTEGKSTEANVVVTNLTDSTVASPIAIIGIPGGLEPRHDQLKELVKSGQIAAYEVKGNDVVLYWRDLSAKGIARISLSLIASFPGSYTGTASSAYLYYVDEHKKWVDGLHAEIAAR